MAPKKKTISWSHAPILGVGVLLLASAGIAPPGKSAKQDHEGFSLSFSTAGLGSGMGTLQPAFRVKGVQFSYTLEQNSHYGERTLESQVVCSGSIRSASIDSIITLAKSVGDTLVYRTNAHIMSGSISELAITDGNFHVRFNLHNDSDPVADKIITILNSNIPTDKERLFILDPQ
jgi:hypothetical protein